MQVLDVSRCDKISSSGLISVIRGHSGLKQLYASYCFFVSEFPFGTWIQSSSLCFSCYSSGKILSLKFSMQQELSTTLLYSLTELKNLKTIRVDGAQVSGSSFHMICTNCKFLVEIGMSKCKGVTDTGLIQLASACPNLKIINLICCDSITDAAISAITESCRNLSCLKVELCNFLT